ncbi:DNA-binding protein [Marinithermofilum abyssi]|uniref:DNA-binding protein n=1 Tax=Marinithermofilum abyssi TaxID=1571185 RepID=A0A8J2YDM6_9BACL|nr:XRE family transcriptional regulator [Marinithermofilum abyssi]GGE11999.1 DNA-binding protein [Marinithermofilum abyssi]
MNKEDLNRLIGSTLKRIRSERKMSLDNAAALTGVSKPMLAQIEKGESNPTVSTLWKIAAGLGVPFSTFLEKRHPEVKKVDRDSIEPLKEDEGRMLVVPLFSLASGNPFEIYALTLKPGCHYVSAPHLEGVEEYNFIEEGEMILEIEEMSYTLKKGESIRFTANVSHTYINETNRDCRLLTMIHYK